MDNPFSEAQFKTLKYHPGFPGRFEDITAAIAFCRSFFPWYNTEHRHAGIAMLTPDDVPSSPGTGCAGSARTYPASRLGPSPRTLRPRHPETRPASRSRLDQPTRHFHNRRNESVNRNRRCLKVVDRFQCLPLGTVACSQQHSRNRRSLAPKIDDSLSYFSVLAFPDGH